MNSCPGCGAAVKDEEDGVLIFECGSAFSPKPDECAMSMECWRRQAEQHAEWDAAFDPNGEKWWLD